MFFPAADTIAFSEGGVESMRIDSSGNVGIGTSSPVTRLDVVGGTTTIRGAALFNTSSTAGTGSSAYIRSANAFSSATTPDYTWWFNDQCGVFHPASDVIGFSTTGTERMRITGAGNVGIGTTTPESKLNLQVDTAAATIAATPSIVLSNRNNTNSTFMAGGLFADFYRDVADPSYAAGIWFERVPASGNFSSDANIIFGSQANGTSSVPTERMRIASDGSVLVGDTATGAYFDGNLNVFKSNNIPMCVKIGTVSAWNISCWSTPTSGDNQFLVFGTEGTFNSRGSITYNRTAGLTAYNTTSDQRLKDNIVDASSALSKINSVKIRSFDWKETGNHVDFGVIAQELIIVAPECVTKGQDNDDGTIKNAWSVDTSALIPALVKAIQELKTTVDAQAVEIAALKAK
jgi:hypothetical protein